MVNVLVVDDCAMMRGLMKQFLRNENVTVFYAVTAAEAAMFVRKWNFFGSFVDGRLSGEDSHAFVRDYLVGAVPHIWRIASHPGYFQGVDKRVLGHGVIDKANLQICADVLRDALREESRVH